MIRSALLALDGSSASKTATELTIQLVKRQARETPEGIFHIQLTGIAVLDKPTITKREAVPVGGGAWKKQRDETRLAEADQKTLQILDEFQASCEEAGIDHDVIRAVGLPYEEIASASHVHDLISIGRDTNFQFQTREDSCETVKRLLRDHPCPVVVTPPEAPEGNSLVIAYDGSRASSRAAHMFALMDFNLSQVDVHVVSVNRSKEQAQVYCDEVKDLLNRHNISAQSHPVASSSRAAQGLIDKANELKARAIVMGAFGRTGLQAAFLGSATRTMLQVLHSRSPHKDSFPHRVFDVPSLGMLWHSD